MLDASLPLRSAYLSRLNGNITGITGVDGITISTPIPVYDSAGVPAEAVEPFVLLSSFFSSETGQGTKDTYGQSVSLLVDIVTSFPNSFGGKQQADQIANKVLTLVRTRSGNYVNMGSDWNVITTTLEMDQTQENQQPDRYIVRRLLRFNHLIQQLTNNE